MPAKCQFPISGSKEDGTLRLCGEPAIGFFDFTVPNQSAQHRYVCWRHRDARLWGKPFVHCEEKKK